MCLPILGTAQRNDTTTWHVLLGGSRAGFLKKWKNADASYSEWFQWNDRGRGDSTVTTYAYNAQGYIVHLEGRGVDYYKKPVTETFENNNGVVRWQNAAEKEERTINYPAEYLPVSIFAGMSYSHYFRAPQQTIQLLPSGTSTLTVLKEHTLPDGQRLRLVSQFGSGMTPSYTWIDANDEFFATPGDWFALIRNGYESHNEELYQLQQSFQQAYFKDLRQKLTQTPPGIVIKNATLFHARTKEVQPNTTIVVANGVVTEVTTGQVKTATTGFHVIDATGKFVMPGLWDNHVHYGDETQGLLHLGCGVTNVRDMGSAASLLDRKRDIDQGVVIGPRIQVMSGFIDGAGPYALPIGEAASSLESALAAVKRYADLGYRQLKLYSSLNPQWVKPLAAEAKRLDMRVSGHIPAHMLAEEAVRDGYDEIQHLNMLFLNFYGKDLDTRTPLRFSAVAQKAAFIDFNSAEVKAFINLLKQHQTVIDPTVSFFEDMFSGQAGAIKPSAVNYASRLPVTLQRSFKGGSAIEIPAGMDETYRKSFVNMLAMLKLLFDSGITMVPGTDDMAGFAYHRELENYVRAGIPAKDVLQMATWTSAQVNRLSDRYGSIEPNRPADIVIIDGDPVRNILDIQRVEMVIKDQALYNTKAVLQAVSIQSY